MYIEKLLAMRKEFPELANNPYLFANTGKEKAFLDGSKAISKIAQQMNVAFTAGKYRKLVASEAVFVQDPLKQKL